MKNILQLFMITLFCSFFSIQASDGPYTLKTQERSLKDSSCLCIIVTTEKNFEQWPHLKDYFEKIGTFEAYVSLISRLVSGNLSEFQSLKSIITDDQCRLLLKYKPNHFGSIFKTIDYHRSWPTDTRRKVSIFGGLLFGGETMRNNLKPCMDQNNVIFSEHNKALALDIILGQKKGSIFYDKRDNTLKVQ